MSERRVNVRLQAVGGDNVKRELHDVGASGKASLSEIAEGGKKAGSGMDAASKGAGDLGDKTGRLMRSGGMRNLSQQLSQVAQSGMASGDWLKALAIQIPDIMLSFGTLGALAGAAAGLMLPLVANLITGGDNAKEMKDALKELEGGIKDYQDAVDMALSPTEKLADQFGSMAARMRPLLQDMAANKRLDLAADIQGVIGPLLEPLENARGQMRAVREGILAEGFDLNQGMMGVSREFRGFTDEIGNSLFALEQAKDVTSQLAAAERLRAVYVAAADARGGRDESERARIGMLDELILKMAAAVAQDERLAAAAATTADAQERAADAAEAAAEGLAQGTTPEQSAKILTDAAAAAGAAVDASDAMARARQSAADAQAALSESATDVATMQATAAAVATVQESWADFQQIVGGDLSAMVTPWIDAMTAMSTAADQAGDDTVAAFQGALDAISALVEPARAAGAAIGRNIVEGAVEGIDSKKAALTDRARAMSQAVRDAVTTDLQIQSPSRVMRGYGQNVAEGLALGITDQSDKAADAASDLAGGIKTGWASALEDMQQYAADAMDLGGNIGDGIIRAFKGAEQALAEFVQTGKADMKGFVSSVIADFAQIGARRFIFGPLMNALSGVMGGIGGGYAGATVMHSGGIVGSGGTARQVPASLFAGAQRFHGGGWPGLRSDEVPAILQRGERVLSRSEVAQGGSGVVVNIQTPDPRSFQASRAQIAADLARAVGAGRRGI